MTEQLDVGRFQLDAFKAAVQARVDLLKATAEYNLKMQQVINQHLKNVDLGDKIYRARDAYRDFKLALAKSKREALKAQRELDKVELAIRHQAGLALGEILAADLVTRGWAGYQALIARSSLETRVKLAQVKASATARKAKNFEKPRTPNATIKTVPSEIKFALPMFHWVKSKSYVPRIGSSAQKLLIRMLQIIEKGAAADLVVLNSKIDATKEELAELRKLHWKRIDWESKEPK